MGKSEFSALIMAGGRSERMRATSGVHKAQVKIAGKSLLQRNLETLLAEGFRDITVAVSVHELEIEAFVLGACRALVSQAGGRISCFRETLPLGTIGAARAVLHEGAGL